MGSADDASITTERLELMLLGRTFLANTLVGDPKPDPGFSDPAGFLSGAADIIRLRLAQLEADPGVASWLLRALVLRGRRIAVGFIGFHAAPNEEGTAEIGYEVLPDFRGRLYASEAIAALIAWAGSRGLRTVRACVSPENRASLALLGRQGFVLVGEQLDAEDGRELVFEKPVHSGRANRDATSPGVVMGQNDASGVAVPAGARAAARVLVLDRSDRLLLVQERDSDGHRWWIAPGGGLEPGESFEDAARREVHEETGLAVQLGPWVWTRRHIYQWNDRWFDQYERYFVARTYETMLTPSAADSSVVDARWWSAPELAVAQDDFAPRSLATLIVDIVAGRLPSTPIDCGV